MFILFEIIDSQQILPAVLLIIISSISAFYYIRMVKIIFFEPKQIERSYEKFQVVFHNSSLNSIYIILSVLLFIIVVLFFFPTTLILLCQYIILHITNF